MSARSLDKMRKDFSKIIGELGLQITAQSNLKIVNYLDVTLNLSTGKFCPYRKPDNYPLYINAKSNHPPSIIKRLPATISTRISSLSCDADEFNKASRVYNDALKTSGYRGAFNMQGTITKQATDAGTDQETSFGSIRHTARMSRRTLRVRSSALSGFYFG